MAVNPELRVQIGRIVSRLQHSRSVLFITGAGLSADSGLPVYRGIGGLYQDRSAEEGLPIEVLLSGQMFRAEPERTWKHLADIAAACEGACPNRAHEIIAEFERRLPRVWVFTQNVDGFHRTSGSVNVVDIHGDLHHLRCTMCRWRTTVERLSDQTIPPTCPQCSAMARPDVVLFGERLCPEKIARMQRELARGFDVLFVIGTTALFPYIAGPVMAAAGTDTLTVEINPGRTDLTNRVDIALPLSAVDALTALYEMWISDPSASSAD